jgi:outer membrane usher protein
MTVAQVDSGGSRSLEAFVTMTYALEAQTAASVSASRHDGRDSASFAAQRSVPMGEGFGYRVAGDSGGAGQLDTSVQYQSAYGTYQAEYHRNGDQNTGVAQAAGGLVVMSGDVFVTRPVQDGYALIQVPGVGGVRGFLNNQEVGRTNARGNLLVPALSSYYGNRLSISATDLPLDYDVGGTEQLVATYLRSGARVLFPVRQIQALTGLMETEEGQPPAFGELRVPVDGQVVASPIGSDGRFWLDGLPAGRHNASVEFGGGVCRVALEVPVSSERSLDLGLLRCNRADPIASR